jgi:hypothetical protein
MYTEKTIRQASLAALIIGFLMMLTSDSANYPLAAIILGLVLMQVGAIANLLSVLCE